MKQKFALSACGVAIMLALSGCGSSANLFGGGKPDGIPVSRAAPLVVPPDFPLVPAQATVVRTQDGVTQEQVTEAMFGGPAPRSASERAVIAAAGTSELGIRSTVGDPATLTINKGTVTRDIIAAPEGDGQTAQAAIPQ
jgi:Protein of unknown function (DUF3035)